jgi:hypothetical protein
MPQSHTEHLIYDLARDSFALLSNDRDAKRLVVFVHGFGGHPSTTWGDFPIVIGAEKSWARTDAIFYAYSHASKLDSIQNNTADFLRFLQLVYPTLRVLHDSDGELVRTYDELILVGHSEGGVLIREAVSKVVSAPLHRLKSIVNSRLSLFAPAHFGFSPVGITGALLTLGLIGAIKRFAVALSPAATEMEEKVYLEGLRDIIKFQYGADPSIKALSAHVLYGRDEKTVVRMYMPQDCCHDPEPERDHTGICKPTFAYLRPLQIVDGDCP